MARNLAVAIEKAERPAVSLAKSAVASIRKTTYHEAYVQEARKFLPAVLADACHTMAKARSGGIASGAVRRQKRDSGQGELSLEKGNKPLGAAFSHARASGKDQSKKARKRRANAYLRSQGHAPISKADGLTPPAGVQTACKRGLELAPEHGGPGLTEGAKARARSMAAGNAVSSSQLARMRSFFARHTETKSSSPPSPGYVSWLLWGGDAGKRWADSKAEQLSKGGPGSGRYPAGSHGEAEAASGQARDRSKAAAMQKTTMAHSLAQIAHTVASSSHARVGDHVAARMHDEKAAFHREQARASSAKRLTKMAPLPSEFTEPTFGDGKKRTKKRKDKDRVDFSVTGKIIKSATNAWQRLVYSVVYAPDTVDLHGDAMDAATIEKAAHEAMRQGIYINHEHAGDPLGAHVVESYIAPCDMQIGSASGATAEIRKGTWVMGMKVTDDDVWQRVVDGTYRGFSLEGTGIAELLEA